MDISTYTTETGGIISEVYSPSAVHKHELVVCEDIRDPASGKVIGYALADKPPLPNANYAPTACDQNKRLEMLMGHSLQPKKEANREREADPPVRELDVATTLRKRANERAMLDIKMAQRTSTITEVEVGDMDTKSIVGMKNGQDMRTILNRLPANNTVMSTARRSGFQAALGPSKATSNVSVERASTVGKVNSKIRSTKLFETPSARLEKAERDDGGDRLGKLDAKRNVVSARGASGEAPSRTHYVGSVERARLRNEKGHDSVNTYSHDATASGVVGAASVPCQHGFEIRNAHSTIVENMPDEMESAVVSQVLKRMPEGRTDSRVYTTERERRAEKNSADWDDATRNFVAEPSREVPVSKGGIETKALQRKMYDQEADASRLAPSNLVDGPAGARGGGVDDGLHTYRDRLTNPENMSLIRRAEADRERRLNVAGRKRIVPQSELGARTTYRRGDVLRGVGASSLRPQRSTRVVVGPVDEE